jgi:uncharacterized membrane protein
MHYCPQCGAALEPQANFCPRCGRDLTSSGEQPGRVMGPPRPRGPEIRPGRYLKTGWEIFKQYPAGFMSFAILSFLIFLILVMPLYFLLAIPRIGPALLYALAAPLWVGPLLVSARIMQGRTVAFSHFFAGFHYWLPLFLMYLVSQVLIGLGLLLLIIPGIYLLVSYLFASWLIMDRGLDFWAALEESRRTVQKNWFGWFVFLLLLYLINLGGAVLFGLGLMLTVPLSSAAITAAYADVFGIKSTTF